MSEGEASVPAWPADWLRPDWPAPASVRAVCTTRQGVTGSAAGWADPRHDFNLGDHVGDRPERVALHRAQLAAWLGGRPVFLQQVHGQAVATLTAHSTDGSVADVAITTTPGLACTVMVADCLPILLTDRRGRVVAAAHAGWRGLAGAGGVGVVEAAVAAMRAADVSAMGEALAWLGPCIGPSAFEVGDEVRAAFCDVDAAAAQHFQWQPGGRWLANLPALARQRLKAQGVTAVYGNDGSADWCTVTQNTRFFSYRRDQQALGASGRQAACIWLVA